MANIPSAYTQIPYIGFTGTQYINTGYYHKTGSTRYEMTIMPTSLPNTYHCVFGARSTHDGAEAYYLGIRNTAATYGCIGGNKKDPMGFSLNVNTPYVISSDPVSGWTVEGTLYVQPYSSAVTSAYPCYIGAGNYGGSFSEPFYGRIYSFKIYEQTSLVRDFIPCIRKSDQVSGLYDSVSQSFFTNSGSGTFVIPYSLAVNAKSFATYITSLCTTFDGTALTSSNKTQLINFLTEDFSNTQQVINISTARNMVNKLRVLMTGSSKSITIPSGYESCILSVNTAKQLVDVMLPTSEGLRAKFVRLNQIYRTTNTFDTAAETVYYNMKWTFYLPAASSFGSPTLSGTLYGGGGGGSGGQAHDGNKDSNYMTRAGGGGTGGTSLITLNGAEKAKADGGAGAAAWDAGPSGGNPNWSNSGKPGSDGSSASVSFTVTRKQPLVITIGAGGGGGGGFGCCAATGNDYRGEATNGSGSTGGNGAERNSFADDDQAFGGGGGAGGGGGTSGSNKVSGPNRSSRNNPGVDINGVGAYGGYCSSGSNGAQPNTMGTGGYAGKAYNSVDVYSNGNGGNGGNAGGFQLNSSCSAASALFVFR